MERAGTTGWTRGVRRREDGGAGSRVVRDRSLKRLLPIKQLRRLCNTLRPRNRPQERVLGPLQYLNAYGLRLGEVLVDAADPFRIEHAVLELGPQ